MPNLPALQKLQGLIQRTTAGIPKIQDQAIETGDFTELRRAQGVVKQLSGLADRLTMDQQEAPPAPSVTPPPQPAPPRIQPVNPAEGSEAPPLPTYDVPAPPGMGLQDLLNKRVPTPEPDPVAPQNDFMVQKANASKSVHDAVRKYVTSLGPSRRGSFKDDAPFVKDDDGSVVPLMVKVVKSPDQAAFILAEAGLAQPTDQRNPFYREVEEASRAYKALLTSPQGLGGEADIQGTLALRDRRLREQKQAGLEGLLGKEQAGLSSLLERRAISPREQAEIDAEAKRRGEVIGGITEQQALLDRNKPKPLPEGSLDATLGPGIASLAPLAQVPPGSLPAGLSGEQAAIDPRNAPPGLPEMKLKAEQAGMTPQGLVDSVAAEADATPGYDLEKEFVRMVKMMGLDRRVPTWERVLTAMAYGAANIFSRWVSRNWRMPLNFPDLYGGDRQKESTLRQLGLAMLTQQAADRRQQASIRSLAERQDKSINAGFAKQAMALAAKERLEAQRENRKQADDVLARANFKLRALEASNRAEADSFRIRAIPITEQMDAMQRIMNEARNPVTGEIDSAKYDAAYKTYKELVGQLSAMAGQSGAGIVKPPLK